MPLPNPPLENHTLQSDAAPGQIALVRYGADGKRQFRIELAESLYHAGLVETIEAFMRANERPLLRLEGSNDRASGCAPGVRAVRVTEGGPAVDGS